MSFVRPWAGFISEGLSFKVVEVIEIMNKWLAVAAQTARSRCRVGLLSILYVYCFMAYQRQMTPHGVRVITKLYFVISEAFKESMTLNKAQKSLNVIHFGGNRKSVYDFI